MSTLREAIAAAKAAGLEVRVDAFGGPDGLPLLSEYDRLRRTISVNALTLNRLRASHGKDVALRFAACAVWHELYHHRHPDGGEAAAHAFAREH